MSKKALILAIGCQLHPWLKMFRTSLETWDKDDVPGCETVFYFGNPAQPNTDKAIYFPLDESYSTMGHKLLMALRWALENREWDYLARVNSSCYVDKRELMRHIQTLPDTNVFSGSIIKGCDALHRDWVWGGGQYVVSRDVVQKIVDAQDKWNHGVMEDVAFSWMATDVGVPFMPGPAVAIDQDAGKWRYVCYNGISETFVSEKVVTVPGNFFYRVKQDHDRNLDEYLMRRLFAILG